MLVKVSPTDGSSTCPLMTRLAHLMKEFQAFHQALDAKKAAITQEKQTFRAFVSGAGLFQAQTAEPIPFMRATRGKRKIERARPETDL